MIIRVMLTKPIGKFKPLSWLIRLCENTPFSHVCLNWDSYKIERSLVYEAVGAGIRFIGSIYFLDHVYVVKSYQFDITEDAHRHMVQYCVDNSGKPYSRCHLIGLAWMRLCKLFGLKVKNPFKDGDYSQVCVEAIIRALSSAGLDLGLDAEDSGLIEVEKALDNLHLALNARNN